MASIPARSVALTKRARRQTGHPYPFRIACRFGGQAGYVVADQLRTVDQVRMVRRLGELPTGTMAEVLGVLRRMFAA